MNGNDLIVEVAGILRDPRMKQWDRPRLAAALNEAIAEVCNAKPEAYTVLQDLTLSSGTQQRIPDDSHLLIDIVRNVTPGKPQRAVSKVDQSAFDAMLPDWRSDRPSGTVKHYMKDEINDDHFQVYPPVVGDRGPRPIVLPEPITPVEPIDPGPVGSNAGVTQADLDAYQAALIQYENDLLTLEQRQVDHAISVKALAEWEALPDLTQVRATLAKVPCLLDCDGVTAEINDTSALDLLERPIEPVDPGPVGFGLDSNFVASLGSVIATPSTTNGFDGFHITLPREQVVALGGTNPNNYTTQTGDLFKITMVAPFAGWNGGLNQRARFNAFTIDPESTGGLQMSILYEDSNASIAVNYNDPRLAPGNVIQVLRLSNSAYQLLPDFPDVEGVSQELVDTYQADLAAFQSELEIYNTIIRNAGLPNLRPVGGELPNITQAEVDAFDAASAEYNLCINGLGVPIDQANVLAAIGGDAYGDTPIVHPSWNNNGNYDTEARSVLPVSEPGERWIFSPNRNTGLRSNMTHEIVNVAPMECEISCAVQRGGSGDDPELFFNFNGDLTNTQHAGFSHIVLQQDNGDTRWNFRVNADTATAADADIDPGPLNLLTEIYWATLRYRSPGVSGGEWVVEAWVNGLLIGIYTGTVFGDSRDLLDQGLFRAGFGYRNNNRYYKNVVVMDKWSSEPGEPPATLRVTDQGDSIGLVDSVLLTYYDNLPVNCGREPVLPVENPVTLDGYLAFLEQATRYNIALSGVDTLNPCLPEFPLPVAADSIPEPIDPGPLGFGGDRAADGFANAILVENPSTIPVTYRITPESAEVTGGVSALGLSGRTIDIKLPDDLGDAEGSATEISLNNIAYADYAGFGGNFIRIDRSATDNTDLTWAEVNGGDVLRITFPDGFTSDLVAINQFNDGVTQEQIDAYLAQRDAYDRAISTIAAAESQSNQLIFNASSALKLSDEIPMAKTYIPSIREFMLYRCYSVDDEMTPNYARAAVHYQRALEMLGIRTNSKNMVMQERERIE